MRQKAVRTFRVASGGLTVHYRISRVGPLCRYTTDFSAEFVLYFFIQLG